MSDRWVQGGRLGGWEREEMKVEGEKEKRMKGEKQS